MKKRNPQDLTLRNLRAMKQRLVNVHQALLTRIKRLEDRLAVVEGHTSTNDLLGDSERLPDSNPSSSRT